MKITAQILIEELDDEITAKDCGVNSRYLMIAAQNMLRQQQSEIELLERALSRALDMLGAPK